MNYETTAPAKLNGKPISNPLARNREASVPQSNPSTLADYQGGCVRAWLTRNAGVALIAVGWLFAFIPVLAPIVLDHVIAFVIAAWLFGMGLGWLVRSEGDGK